MKTWFRTIFNKDDEKHLIKSNKKMRKNIYGSKTESQHQKRFHLIHFVFKYKFAVPLIFLAKKILNKHLVKKIPKGSHNTNIRLFNKSYDNAVNKWVELFLRNQGDVSTRMTKRQCNKRARNDAYLPVLKEIINTLYIHDTAYREFVNILMHEIAHDMVKHYSKYPNKKTGHLFFSTDMYEVNYYLLEKRLRYNIELVLTDAKKALEVKNN
jgi:hypothetical protein